MRPMPSQSFSLLVSIPDEDPARHDLEGEAVAVGRGPDNGIQILVAEVSVKHGEFRSGEDSWRLVDTGSTNGTKVNGNAIDEEGVDLKPMDKILFGATIAAYFVPSAVLDSTPPEELIASLESPSDEEEPAAEAAPVEAKPAPAAPGGAKPAPAAPGAAKPGTPPVAQPAKPAGVAPVAAGAQTVKLNQVRPSAPGGGPAKPAPAAPGAAKPAPVAKPAPAAPGGAKPAPAAPGAAKPAPAAPAKPSAPPAPGGASPAAPKPVAPVPLKRPGAGQAPQVPKPPEKKEEG